MGICLRLTLFFSCILYSVVSNATSLSDAQAAVEANLKTSEGKAYDQQLGKEFVGGHLGVIRQCKQSSGDDKRSFWILMKLSNDGLVNELLFYPETKLGQCSRDSLLKDHFSAPPRADYWVSVYIQLSH